jgi:hypothetical protein
MSKHDDPIIDYFEKESDQREKRLHQAYQNRALLEFTHGLDWFVKHVNDIFLEYGIPSFKSPYPSNSGIAELDDYLNNTVTTVDWIRSCWEVDNDYFEDI